MSFLSFLRRKMRIAIATTRARPQITPATTAKMFVDSPFVAAAVVEAEADAEEVFETGRAFESAVADISSMFAAATVMKASSISKLVITGATAAVVGVVFLVSSAFFVSGACVAAAVAAVFAEVAADVFATVLAAPP